MKIEVKNTIDPKSKRIKSRTAVSNAASKKEYKQLKKDQIKQKKSNQGGNIKSFLITILLIIMAIVLVFTSGLFNISEIIVENNTHVSNEQAISFSRIQLGTNLFSISTRDVIDNLKENSYINNAWVKRCFPNKVKLIIDERNVDFVLQLADSYVYIDKNGYILEISNVKPDVLLITGASIDSNNIKENSKLNDEDIEKIKVVIRIMKTAEKNDMSNLISKIDISDNKDFVIYLDTEGKIVHLGDGTELNTRFLYVKAILKEQKEKNGEIFVNVDLNSEYVYFRENI